MIISINKTNVAEVGDRIYYKKKMRKVIGYAVGDDGIDCYVTSFRSLYVDGGYEWSTFLVPIDEVKYKLVEVPLKEG